MVKKQGQLTEILFLRAPTFTASMLLTLRAVLEWLVTVTNITEEVDLILMGKKRCTNTVDGRIAPSLIIKATLAIQVVEKLGVSLATPEVKISDFKVTPDCQPISKETIRQHGLDWTYNGNGCKFHRHHQR